MRESPVLAKSWAEDSAQMAVLFTSAVAMRNTAWQTRPAFATNTALIQDVQIA